jgi:hypothetical protein
MISHQQIITEALNVLDKREPFVAQEFRALKPESIARLFFMNKRSNRGLRLTETGYNFFIKCFEHFSVNFKEEYTMTGRHRIFLDRFCTAPYHICKERITLFDREEAFKIKMVDADIELLANMHKQFL